MRQEDESKVGGRRAIAVGATAALLVAAGAAWYALRPAPGPAAASPPPPSPAVSRSAPPEQSGPWAATTEPPSAPASPSQTGSVAASPSTAPSPSPSPSPSPTGRSGALPDVTIAFGGDTLAEGSAGRINKVGLGETGDVLAAADLAMVNLETVVVENQEGLQAVDKQWNFVTGPRIVSTLADEGVDVVTAANNHGMDYGDEGLRRMLQFKAKSPLPIVGIGADDKEAWAPWETEVRGRKVFMFGATQVVDTVLDWKAGPGKPGLAKIKDADGVAKLLDRVRQVRADSPDHVIVVYLHSGTEQELCPTDRQLSITGQLAEAGADVVVAAHAHRLQPTTVIGDTAIAYGMGNFVFSSRRPETRATGVLTVTVPGGDGPPTMEFAPATISDGIPVLLHGAERKAALANWESLGDGCAYPR